LAAFLNLQRSDIEVDVVITDQSPYSQEVRLQAVGHGNIHVHGNLPTLASLMVKADVAIGAGGVTSWERCCLGLPALVVTLAENQRSIADALHRQGVARWLGHKDEVGVSDIQQALAEVLNRGLEETWSLSCRKIVDGKGAAKVCAALTVTAASPLWVRAAGLSDEALLLAWANDPVTRSNAFISDIIPAETHHHWFCDRLRDLDNCRLYIVETEDGVPLGQVRFERKKEAWEISYALVPHFRGRGLGRPMLESALLKLSSEKSGVFMLARVKRQNRPSCKIFESLGFVGQSAGETMVYRNAL
jgi:RimJ/RimL family protein N-acetyltransferase